MTHLPSSPTEVACLEATRWPSLLARDRRHRSRGARGLRSAPEHVAQSVMCIHAFVERLHTNAHPHHAHTHTHRCVRVSQFAALTSTPSERNGALPWRLGDSCRAAMAYADKLVLGADFHVRNSRGGPRAFEDAAAPQEDIATAGELSKASEQDELITSANLHKVANDSYRQATFDPCANHMKLAIIDCLFSLASPLQSGVCGG